MTMRIIFAKNIYQPIDFGNKSKEDMKIEKYIIEYLC